MKKNKTLSIIIPVYNEEKTIGTILQKVIKLKISGWKKTIIVVDDGSTDNTPSVIAKFAKEITWLKHTKNKGKGASIRTALKQVSSEAIIIQDADLEYTPSEYLKLLPFFDKHLVIYGSRNLVIRKKGYFIYFWGGRLLSYLTSLLYNYKITDINTCYKLFKTSLLKEIKFTENGFAFCEEITCKLLKKGIKIKEVPVTYTPRTFKEGKKLRLIDGLYGFYKVISLRLTD